MLTTTFRQFCILCVALILLSCHTTRTVTATESTQSKASQLRHVEGSLITTTVEYLADIDTTGTSPRLIPRPYTPAKLTVQEKRVSLADTNKASYDSNAEYYQTKEHVRNLSPNFEPFRITAISVIIIIIAVLLFKISLSYFKH
jgi:hypothetical protein